MFVALLLAACNPFASLRTDEDIAVADNDVAAIELLVPDRHLPASARNVRVHVLHFQDTILDDRFEAPFEDARRFAEQLTGRPLVRGRDPWQGHPPDLDWWPQTLPPGAYATEDMTVDGSKDGMPAARLILLRQGDPARVWLETFTT
jgi:hypothetical protein